MTFEEICTCPLLICPRHEDLVNQSLVSQFLCLAFAKPNAERRTPNADCCPHSHDGSMVLVYMGVSENSVPLSPMVNDHYPY